jgi:hypothetical protein
MEFESKSGVRHYVLFEVSIATGGSIWTSIVHYLRRTNFRCVISALQLLGETFVEGKRACFCTRIVYILGMHHETRHARNCDNMTMIVLDHCRSKLLDKQEMCNGVDSKSKAQLIF